MPALDLSVLSPEVTLLGTTIVAGPRSQLTSTPVTGFSDVASATVVVRVERVDNNNGEVLSVTVQGSDDGNSWSTVAGPYSFARDGTESLVVDDPPDRLRVAWSAPAGVREAAIGSVTARLGVVDAPGGESGGSQPFTPTDLDDLGLWLDASELPAGTLASWADGSPNGYDAAQATGGDRPTVVAAVRNGLNVVRFAAGKFMEFTGDALGLTAGVDGITIAYAAAPDASAESPVFGATMEGDDTQLRFGIGLASSGAGQFYALGASLSPAVDYPGWIPRLAAYSVEADGAALYESTIPGDWNWGNPHGNPPVSASPSAAMWLGKDPFSDTADHDLGELIVVRRACDAGERRQVLEYLAAKWATL